MRIWKKIINFLLLICYISWGNVGQIFIEVRGDSTVRESSQPKIVGVWVNDKGNSIIKYSDMN